jgi:hypothetical protein
MLTGTHSSERVRARVFPFFCQNFRIFKKKKIIFSKKSFFKLFNYIPAKRYEGGVFGRKMGQNPKMFRKNGQMLLIDL